MFHNSIFGICVRFLGCVIMSILMIHLILNQARPISCEVSPKDDPGRNQSNHMNPGQMSYECFCFFCHISLVRFLCITVFGPDFAKNQERKGETSPSTSINFPLSEVWRYQVAGVKTHFLISRDSWPQTWGTLAATMVGGVGLFYLIKADVYVCHCPCILSQKLCHKIYL